MGKRFSIIVLSVFLLSALLFCTPVLAKSKAKKPALVKKAVTYSYNGKKKKWEKVQVQNFQYQKAYPASVRTVDYGYGHTTAFRYSFKGKKPKKMKQYDEAGNLERTVKYQSGGQPGRILISSATDETEYLLTYGKKNYFTSLHIETTRTDPGDPSDIEYAEEVDSIEVTTKGGLLKKTVNRGIFANWTSTTKKKWSRFDGTYTAKYDKNGIVHVTSARFKTFGSSGKQLKFRVKWKNGRIVKVIRYSWDSAAKKGKGAWTKDSKFTFKYTDTKIGKVRYAEMINAFVMGEDNLYYRYCWY